MGYRLNGPDEPVLIAVPKPMLTEFGIHFIIDWRVVYSISKVKDMPEGRIHACSV